VLGFGLFIFKGNINQKIEGNFSAVTISNGAYCNGFLEKKQAYFIAMSILSKTYETKTINEGLLNMPHKNAGYWNAQPNDRAFQQIHRLTPGSEGAQAVPPEQRGWTQTAQYQRVSAGMRERWEAREQEKRKQELRHLRSLPNQEPFEIEKSLARVQSQRPNSRGQLLLSAVQATSTVAWGILPELLPAAAAAQTAKPGPYAQHYPCEMPDYFSDFVPKTPRDQWNFTIANLPPRKFAPGAQIEWRLINNALSPTTEGCIGTSPSSNSRCKETFSQFNKWGNDHRPALDKARGIVDDKSRKFNARLSKTLIPLSDPVNRNIINNLWRFFTEMEFMLLSAENALKFHIGCCGELERLSTIYVTETAKNIMQDTNLASPLTIQQVAFETDPSSSSGPFLHMFLLLNGRFQDIVSNNPREIYQYLRNSGGIILDSWFQDTTTLMCMEDFLVQHPDLKAIPHLNVTTVRTSINITHACSQARLTGNQQSFKNMVNELEEIYRQFQARWKKVGKQLKKLWG